MSNIMPGLFGDEVDTANTEQTLFDYEAIPADKRGFVLQKTAETQWLLKRSAEDIIAIGINLISVKKMLPHGMFAKWIRSEFGINPVSAWRFMQVAQRFEGKSFTVKDLSASVLYELSAPSTTNDVIDKVQSGQIQPTVEDIKTAKLEARLAREAEAKARADALAAQQQLFNNQEASQSEIEALTKQINALKDEMEVLTTPEIEIREVEKEVIPQSVTLKIETQQSQIQSLTNNLETQKKAIPPETQKAFDALQKQVSRLKEEREQQEATLAAQRERITKQNEDIQSAIRKREFAENQDRIRQSWRQSTSEAHSCLMRVLGQWPTPVDAQSFDADDWARVDHLKNTLKRVIEECNALRYQTDHQIIDDTQSHLPYSLSVIDAQQ